MIPSNKSFLSVCAAAPRLIRITGIEGRQSQRTQKILLDLMQLGLETA
jgi:hypothetical protein